MKVEGGVNDVPRDAFSVRLTGFVGEDIILGRSGVMAVNRLGRELGRRLFTAIEERMRDGVGMWG